MSSIASLVSSDNCNLIELARALGLVLIPVDAAKQPLGRWKLKTANSPDELDAWAAGLPPGAAGLAVLCGRGGRGGSRLLVLDIDCGWAGIQAIMRAGLDAALETRTYSTASGGYHLWYLWDEPGSMPAIKRAAGAYDVLSAGAYAVVTGPGRKLINDGEPARLDAAGLGRLITALEPLRHQNHGGPGAPGSSGEGPARPRPPADERRNITGKLTSRFTGLYHSNAARFGRNCGLFLAALTCKAERLGEGQARRLLLDEHVRAEGPAGHAHETEQQRRAEGIITIASAYSPRYRGRRLDELDERLRDGLPDRARLALISAGAAGRLAARLADAALTAGLRTFTAGRMAWLVGASRARVSAALRAWPALFEPCSAGARGRGRPAARYRLVTIERLWAALSLRGRCRAGAKLSRPALSTSDYRRSLLIQRLSERPGPIAQAALARGLAVTTRTIRRYIRQAGLLVSHHFTEQPITWHNLSTIPDGPGEISGPYHLLAGNRRKRLPPRAAIAAYFLRRGLAVWLVRQSASSYALSSSPDEHARRALRPRQRARLAAARP